MLGLALSLALTAQAGLPPIDAATTPSKPLNSVRAGVPSDNTCDEPVLLVLSGQLSDAAAMDAYSRALTSSGLYQRLGGYELNGPKATDALAGGGAVSLQSVLRFPCRANALAFWHSKLQQDQLALLRGTAQPADLAAAIYPELPLREDLVGKVGDNSYSAAFSAAAEPGAR